MNSLEKLKIRLKDSGEIVEKNSDEMRRNIHPVQCAVWTLFCEKYKYKGEMSIQSVFEKAPSKKIKL